MKRYTRKAMLECIATHALANAALARENDIKRHAISHARWVAADSARQSDMSEVVINTLHDRLVELMGVDPAKDLLSAAWEEAEKRVPVQRPRKSRKSRKATKRVRTATTTVRAKRSTASA